MLAACSPTDGDDGTFQNIGTTNIDFDAPVYVAVGDYPTSLVAGDADGNGSVDFIATFNRLGSDFNRLNPEIDVTATLSILDWDGVTFTETEINMGSLGVSLGSGYLLVGDLGVDGNDDIVAVINSSDDPRVWICTDVSASCATATSVSLPNIATHSVLVELENPANGLDLVAVLPNSSEIFVVLNGNTAAPQSTPTTTSNPSRIKVGDFDGNGDNDVVVTHPGSQKVAVYFGDGLGAFTLGAEYDLDSSPEHIATGNFDVDGDIDFAVTLDASDLVVRFINDGSGVFTDSNFTVGDEPNYIVSADFDGVGGADLMVTHRLETFVTFLAGDTFSTSQITTTRDPFDLKSGLVTNDANLDMIVVEREDRAVSVLAGDGTGGFSRTYIGFYHTVQQPILIDLDGSGANDLDLILLQPFKDRVAILLNP